MHDTVVPQMTDLSRRFILALKVEFSKLTRSLALVLAIAAPALIAAFSLANLLRVNQPTNWAEWLGGAISIWAYFLLPMTLAALSALICGIEHGPKMWDHLRSLPIPRWYIYAAKTVCMVLLLLFMTVAVPVFTVAAISLGGVLQPDSAAAGIINYGEIARTIGRLFWASLLITAVQLWISLRFSNFVPAIAIGIGGTFFAVVAPSAKIGIYSPWQIPLNAIGEDAARADFALTFGAVMGCAMLLAMILHMSRREVL